VLHPQPEHSPASQSSLFLDRQHKWKNAGIPLISDIPAGMTNNEFAHKTGCKLLFNAKIASLSSYIYLPG